MIRAWAVSGLVTLLLAACTPTSSSSPTQSPIKFAFKLKAGQTYRYHYSSTSKGSDTVGSGPALPIKMEESGDYIWRVVSVDTRGNATIDLTESNLKATLNGRTLPQTSTTTTASGSTSTTSGGSTSTSTTTMPTQHFQFQVAPTGEILSAGSPSGRLLVPGMAQGFEPPGTAVLPSHAVKPGDTWTKTLSEPNPLGQNGSLSYTTENRFLRYENLASGRAAVIQTAKKLPMDVSAYKPEALSGAGLPIGVRVGATVRIQGTSSTSSTTWFDVQTGHVVRTRAVDNGDQTTTYSGITGLPPPGPLRTELQGLLDPEHLVTRVTEQLDLF